MYKLTLLATLLVASVSASTIPRQNGKQFITGPCASDADCASGCCGFTTGKCAGAVIALQRDGGCGFGDAQPNRDAAAALGSQVEITPKDPPAGNAATPSAVNNAGSDTAASATAAAPAAAGTQFITGACTSDADCASGCCGFTTGKCAGAVIALQRDGGCGFGDAQPNRNAAAAMGSQVQITPKDPPAGGAADNASSGTATSSDSTADNSSDDSSASSTSSAAAAAGTQFITGACTSDADCASSCCGFKSGKCAGAIVAQERDGGCGFGDAQPNDTAAQALRGNRRSLRSFH